MSEPDVLWTGERRRPAPQASPTIARLDHGEWFWCCPTCHKIAEPYPSSDAAKVANSRHICGRRLVVPFRVDVAASCGGPVVWWLPKVSVRRRSVLVGWLLFSFYVEVRRVA